MGGRQRGGGGMAEVQAFWVRPLPRGQNQPTLFL